MAGMPGMTGDGPAARSGGPVSGAMTLHVDAPQAGTYKLWLQFRGAGGLHVAPFVLVAR